MRGMEAQNKVDSTCAAEIATPEIEHVFTLHAITEYDASSGFEGQSLTASMEQIDVTDGDSSATHGRPT